MKNLRFILFGSIFLFGISILSTYCSPQKQVEYPEPPDRNKAANHPDQFVWEIFARAFQPAPNDEGNLLWENWASKNYIYKNPCGPPPPWPEGRQVMTPNDPKIPKFLELVNESGKSFFESNLKALTLTFTSPYIEVVRMNRPMFNYIVGNKLYNIDNAYEKAKTTGIDFPSESVVIKAQWKKLEPEELSEYYWREIQHKDKLGRMQQDTLGLVGFHIVSKALPNWVWSTFNHVKDGGRCDYYGCTDEFGVSPSFTPPHKNAIGKQYIPGKLTPDLEALFKKYNLDPVLKNYRLRGTQTEYVDNKGKTILLGNSILEANFDETSSCITCHTYSALNGAFNEIATVDTATIELGIKPSTQLGIHPICYNGIAETEFFYPIDSSTMTVPPDSIYYQLDFMWQLVHGNEHCEDEKKK